MASIALYRRFRPQTFEDVLGQEHVTQTLQSAIRDDRIAHAYLFSGSRGTGKTSTARILAKALNCENGPTPAPCNACEACASITNGNSLDVIEIDAASHGGVDDVRDLRENALLAPAIARRKIYIVDEAHMVSTQGWNAFLKTVEEPPEHVIFVFATTEPHKVLPTILSRCQRFDFRRISSSTLADHLAKICAEDGIQADEGALQLIARAAEGGARDALSTLDQLASAGEVTMGAAARLLGTTTTDVLFDFTDALASSNTGAAIGVLARLVEEGQDLRVFGRNLLEHLRAVLLTKHVEDPGDLIDANDETRARYAGQAEQFGAARLVHAVRLFADALAEIRQQAAPRLTMELAVVRATMPEVDQSATAALARVERLERLLEVNGSLTAPQGVTVPAPQTAAPATVSAPDEREAAPVAGRARATASGEAAPVAPRARATASAKAAPHSASSRAPAKSPPLEAVPDPAAPSSEPHLESAVGLLDIEKLRRNWSIVLEEIRKKSRSLHALVMEATPQAYDGTTVVIAARYSYHAEKLSDMKNAPVIAAAIEAALGVRPKVSAVVREDTRADEPDEIDEARSAEVPAASIDIIRMGFGDDVVEE